jgi:hypothetical protein
VKIRNFLNSPQDADKVIIRQKQRRTIMKASMWGGAALAICIMLSAAAYAAEPIPPDRAPDVDVVTPKRKSPENLIEKSEKLVKEVEKKKAADEAKREEQDKKAKVDKFQQKTGRTPKSWQVLNR